MKKLALFLTAFALVFGLAACADRGDERQYGDDCEEPDGETPCWSNELQDFIWEDGAEITIGVDSDSMGAALVEQWDRDFPEMEGQLTFTNYGSQNDETSGMQGLELAQDEAPDLALVIDNELIGREGAVLPLHEYFIDIGEENTHPDAFEQVNILDYFLLPAFYDGMVFSWNRTMLEEWDVDLTDSNGDNLPDAFDSWEKIFAMADEYGVAVDDRPEFRDEPILEFFPVSLDETWSAYSSLTADGWQLFGGGNFDDPEFADESFLAGLEFIEAFSQTNMSIDETGSIRAADAMGWRWDDYLEGDYPFSLVGTWMDVEGAMEDNDLEFEFSVMPTYNDTQLRPLMKTKGFVINGYTPYPSAASHVLKWLYTNETMGTMINNSAYLPALQEDSDFFPEMDAEFKQDFAVAMQHNQFEVAATLPENPSVRAMDVYYNIDLNEVLKDLWDGNITPEDAQADIVEAADYWIENNNTLD